MDYTEITSRKNEKISCASRLCDKKVRDNEGLFFTEGSKLLTEAVFSGLEIKSTFFTRSALEKNTELLEKLNGEKYLVTDEVYAKLTSESSPEGIFSCIEKKSDFLLSENEEKNGGFIILEDIQNPQNLGAIFRCAYALGFSKIIMSGNCADIYNPKSIRAAMGSLFRCGFLYTDVLEFAQKQKNSGNRVICTALHKDSHVLGDFEFRYGDSIVIGNEGKGVSEKLLEICGESLIIPMTKDAESLNAATAAAIVLWEMKKKSLSKT